MGRKPKENRVKAKQLFIESEGLMTNAEIAQMLDEPQAHIRQWKCVDKWTEELKNKPKKKGGQKGNLNAKGHGAPTRNRNALTHGAYSTVYFDELSEKERELIDSINLNSSENMLRELQTLIAKENDLKKRIATLNTEGIGELYVDKVVEMRTPKKQDEEQGDIYTESEEDKEEGNAPPLMVAMETTIKSSAFERGMKLEAELNKIHGRIIKLLDTIKSYELETRRMELEEKRYALMKQKISGVFDVDPDTGEIDDTYNADDIESLTGMEDDI